MKSLNIVLVLSCAALFFTPGCGLWDNMRGINKDAIPQGPEPSQISSRPDVTGGIVLPVNAELITIDEVITPLEEDLKPLVGQGDYLDFRRKARPVIEQALQNRISNIVLYQKAKKEAREDIDEQIEKAADKEIKQFVAGFNGNYAKAEEAIKKMGMNWKSFKDYQKRLIMVQAYLHEEFKEKRPVTYSDLVNHYQKIKDDEFFTPAAIQFRVIDIMPERITAPDPNTSRLDAARKLSNDLYQKLCSGDDFAALAKEYSNDKARGELGGLWNPVSAGSLTKPYNVLEEAAGTMKVGDISKPIETQDHIFIMKLESKRDPVYQPFEDVQHKVETSLKFQRRREAINEFTEKLMAQAYIGNKDVFIEHCVEKAYRKYK